MPASKGRPTLTSCNYNFLCLPQVELLLCALWASSGGGQWKIVSNFFLARLGPPKRIIMHLNLFHWPLSCLAKERKKKVLLCWENHKPRDYLAKISFLCKLLEYFVPLPRPRNNNNCCSALAAKLKTGPQIIISHYHQVQFPSSTSLVLPGLGLPLLLGQQPLAIDMDKKTFLES